MTGLTSRTSGGAGSARQSSPAGTVPVRSPRPDRRSAPTRRTFPTPHAPHVSHVSDVQRAGPNRGAWAPAPKSGTRATRRRPRASIDVGMPSGRKAAPAPSAAYASHGSHGSEMKRVGDISDPWRRRRDRSSWAARWRLRNCIDSHMRLAGPPRRRRAAGVRQPAQADSRGRRSRETLTKSRIIPARSRFSLMIPSHSVPAAMRRSCQS